MGREKFKTLELYLKNNTDNEITLSFEKLEQLIGLKLCVSAYKYPAYRAPSKTHTLANLFIDTDYNFKVDIQNKKITLNKIFKEKYTIASNYLKNINNQKNTKNVINPSLIITNENIDTFLRPYLKDKNHRYNFYDLCRDAFLKYRKDKGKNKYLALILFSYLSSWGMLRNSFLLQKDFLFNLPIVEILCLEKYDTLYVNTIPTDKDIDLILELKTKIEDCYKTQLFYDTEGKETKIAKVSETLTSKILLGTTGMTLAYDRYVREGLSKYKLRNSFNKESLLELTSIANSNKAIIDTYIKKLGTLYTPMKMLDMFFFIEGMKESQIKKKQLSH